MSHDVDPKELRALFVARFLRALGLGRRGAELGGSVRQRNVVSLVDQGAAPLRHGD